MDREVRVGSPGAQGLSYYSPLLSKPLLGEVLLLYLAVSEHAVSAVLVREEGTKQLPIYYVSKALLDAETRYSHLEKLALALMVAARKLRPYFQAHPVVVVTSFPIKLVLHKPEVSGRLAKWAVELGEYDVIFRPATTIKSQVLADFVAEFSPDLLPALEQEVRLQNAAKKRKRVGLACGRLQQHSRGRSGNRADITNRKHGFESCEMQL